MKTKIIRNIKIDVPAERVLLRSGYSRRAEISPHNSELLMKILPEMNALCQPVIIMADFGIEKKDAYKIILHPKIAFQSKSLAKLLADSIAVTVYVATVGSAVEVRSQKLADAGEYLKSLLWDSFGSEAAEALANHLSNIVTQRAKAKKMKTTRRFSPGYGDLNVKYNRTIVNLLDAHTIGVSVNEAGMLSPRKTTTGFIGWLPD